MRTAEPIAPLVEPAMARVTRPVLARDADATYWMSRYMERAEHIARLLLVNSEALIDAGDVATALLHRHWHSVLEVMNVEKVPENDLPLPQRVGNYMTFDQDNPNSLIRCLTRARENARGIREVISTEMWQHINVLYWSIRADDAAANFQESPDELYQQIISGSTLFQGLTDLTLVHGQRWFFAQLGKYFERITVTCRVLKSKYEILAADETTVADTPLWNIHWTSVLRSCASLESYRRTFLNELDSQHVAQLLILDERFPRSVLYCVREAHNAIAAIRSIVRPRSVDPAERILGRLHAQLEYAEPNDLMEKGLSAYLQMILDHIAEAALAVQQSFFLH